jgi:hypothetical protein
MKRKIGFISNSSIESPQTNDVLTYDSQEEVWKNVPITNLPSALTVGDINTTPNDKGATINSQNQLQLCVADGTHRGVLYGHTEFISGTETDTNTTLGYQSGGSISSPNKENITAIGYKAYKNYTGQWVGTDTTVIGQRALENAQNIALSTVIGCEAGAILQDLIPGSPPSAGNELIAIGYGAAGRNATKTIRKAFNCIHIGNNTDSDTQDASEQIVLGHNVTGRNQEMTVGNYIHQVRWLGLLNHGTGSNLFYPLTVDNNNVMMRFKVPSWQVRLDTSFSVPHATGTTVVFNTLVFEVSPSSSFYNVSSGEYTCPYDGIYWVQASVRFAAANTSLSMVISKNGDALPNAPYDTRQGSSTTQTTLHCSGIRRCLQGEKLSVIVSQISGSSLSLISQQCNFSGHWVGPIS